ncbi:hypothetical protein [Alteromonas macleodii]|uniref:hypothetical protein n=1 Tax=Alteromonas macleodii TaxID=28108 RepID=UPI003BF87DAF
MNSPVIPSNFVEWQNCIVRDCGITLDKAFLESRIAALSNMKDQHTKQFLRLYGKAHYKQVLGWFHQALVELK